MKTNRIKIVVQRPGEISEITVIDNTLQEFQRLVGGHIEVHSLGSGRLIVMNEAGRLKGLPENIRCNEFGAIVGTVLMTAENGEDFRSMTVAEIQSAREWLLRHSV